MESRYFIEDTKLRRDEQGSRPKYVKIYEKLYKYIYTKIIYIIVIFSESEEKSVFLAFS